MNGEVTYAPSTVEASRPALVITDPSPAEARRAVAHLTRGGALDEDRREGLVAAISEVVTNARQHGSPPVTLRAWLASDGRVVLTVTDCGTGIDDPSVGRAPAGRPPGEGGFGLWIAHRMVDEVALGVRADGFVVRLVAGPERAS